MAKDKTKRARPIFKSKDITVTPVQLPGNKGFEAFLKSGPLFRSLGPAGGAVPPGAAGMAPSLESGAPEEAPVGTGIAPSLDGAAVPAAGGRGGGFNFGILEDLATSLGTLGQTRVGREAIGGRSPLQQLGGTFLPLTQQRRAAEEAKAAAQAAAQAKAQKEANELAIKQGKLDVDVAKEAREAGKLGFEERETIKSKFKKEELQEKARLGLGKGIKIQVGGNELQETAFQKQFGKGEATRLTKDLESIKDNARSSFDIRSNIRSVEGALQKGAETGPLAKPAVFANNVAKQLGVDLDLADTASLEQIEAASQRLTIPLTKQLGVNPTDRDAAKIEATTVGLGKSREANFAFIDVSKQATDKSIQHQQIALRLNKEGRPRDIEGAILKWDQENPVVSAGDAEYTKDPKSARPGNILAIGRKLFRVKPDGGFREI